MSPHSIRIGAALCALAGWLAACSGPTPYPIPAPPKTAFAPGTVNGDVAPTAGSRYNPVSGVTNEGNN